MWYELGICNLNINLFYAILILCFIHLICIDSNQAQKKDNSYFSLPDSLPRLFLVFLVQIWTMNPDIDRKNKINEVKRKKGGGIHSYSLSLYAGKVGWNLFLYPLYFRTTSRRIVKISVWLKKGYYSYSTLLYQTRIKWNFQIKMFELNKKCNNLKRFTELSRKQLISLIHQLNS